MARVNCQSTLGSPRCRILRKPATVLAQPKASSTRLRMRWEIAYPGWRVVRASIAERRPLVFCATCGVTALSRSSMTNSDKLAGVVAFVGPERDGLRARGVGARSAPTQPVARHDPKRACSPRRQSARYRSITSHRALQRPEAVGRDANVEIRAGPAGDARQLGRS